MALAATETVAPFDWCRWTVHARYRSTSETTVWYVGIYRSSNYGTFSDAYKDVVRCRVSRRGESCETVESSIGYNDLSDGGTFTIDASTLSAAFLDAVYPMESYDGDGRRTTTSSTPTRVIVDWEGVGDLYTDGGTFTFRSKCYSYRTTFEGASRGAEAYGSAGGTDLGETYDAWLSASTYSNFERTKSC